MKKLLVTGGSGYLGSYVVRASQGKWDTYATFLYNPPVGVRSGIHLPLDLSDAEAVHHIIRSIRPEVIIHTACSNRSTAPAEPGLPPPDPAAAIVPAARNLAEAARDHGLRLIHVSTDLIFDGEHAPYNESSPPSPLNGYGRAKAEADAIVAAIYPAAAIVRPSLIYGDDPVDHATRWLLEGVGKGLTVTLFTDEYRSPIWAFNLALALLELAEMNYSGVLNVAGPLPLNRWEFGLAMLDMLNIQPTPNVVPGSVAGVNPPRARNLTLDVRKAQKLLRTPLLSIDEVIAERREMDRR